MLSAYALQKKLDKPIYHTVRENPFSTVIIIIDLLGRIETSKNLSNNSRVRWSTLYNELMVMSKNIDNNELCFYFQTIREKSKQFAEQGSAMVCLQTIGVDITRAKYGVKYIQVCSTNEK